jgi:hypothetical protein
VAHPSRSALPWKWLNSAMESAHKVAESEVKILYVQDINVIHNRCTSVETLLNIMGMGLTVP